jgi:DNA-directed RNA polymerase I subunit RPA2
MHTINKEEQAPGLQGAALHHIESFNFLIEKGLASIPQHLAPVEISRSGRMGFSECSIGINSLRLGRPIKSNDPTATDQRVSPTECRLAGRTYAAPLLAEFVRDIDGEVTRFTAELGDIPIMVRSKACHLAGLGPHQLVEWGEDAN